jgi:hypothetical protein
MAKRQPIIGQVSFRLDPAVHLELIDIARRTGGEVTDLIREMISFAKPEFRLRADAVFALNRAANCLSARQDLLVLLSVYGPHLPSEKVAQVREVVRRLGKELRRLIGETGRLPLAPEQKRMVADLLSRCVPEESIDRMVAGLLATPPDEPNPRGKNSALAMVDSFLALIAPQVDELLQPPSSLPPPPPRRPRGRPKKQPDQTLLILDYHPNDVPYFHDDPDPERREATAPEKRRRKTPPR